MSKKVSKKGLVTIVTKLGYLTTSPEIAKKVIEAEKAERKKK